ncbi:MAG TPA: carboxypeptidase regulatory-like domain-containing protein [Bryobacteraceae bacterium]|nr:carboxypeptidase regulatory-like domain-containing protein [Bryobacteraceae bacterium]
MKKFLAPFLYLCMACLLATGPAGAQTATGTITGSISDPSGAAIAGAKVQITNTGTNARAEVTTNSEGTYTALLLPVGSYNVRVVATGFKTFELDGIQLQVQQQAQVNASLQVGSMTESVVVQGDASVVETTTSSIGRVVDNKRILELPLNTRNVYTLVNLTPGVTGSIGNAHNGVSFSVNGSRTGTFDVLVDGSSAAFPTVNGFAGLSVFPSVDAVAEFKMQAQNYSAEFGRSMTAVLNVVYKSGTNSFHGSGYEFLRNSVLDANNFFANQRGVPLASFKRNQFGGMVSGPVIKNRTFFMGAYEGLRERSFSDRLTTVPTDRERTGDFSQTRASATQVIGVYDPNTLRPNPNGTGSIRDQFPGNMIPASRFDAVARNVTNYFPRANQPGDPGTGRNNFYNSGAAAINTDNADIRIDHNLTDQQRLFGRFSYRKSFNGPPQLFPGELGVAEGRINNNDFGRNVVVDYTNSLSPSMVLNLRTSFARNRFLYDNQGLDFVPSSLGLPKALDTAVDRFMFPRFAVSTQTALGGGDHRQSGFNNYGLSGSLSKVAGKHSLKYGYEGRMLRINVWEARAAGTFNFGANMTQGPNPLSASSTAGWGYASFLLGTGTDGNFYQNWKNVAAQSFYHAFYVQDDWRVTRKLTLNLGLRYDFDMPRTERYNRMSWFDPDLTSPLAAKVPAFPNLKGGLRFVGVDGNSRSQYTGDYNNLAPRLGFAYQLNEKTVVRGGFAQLFGPSTLAAQGTVGPYGFRVETPWVASLDNVTPLNLLSNPFPAGFQPVPGSSLGALTAIGSNLDAPLSNTNTPYTLQYNFTVQRELPGAILLEVAYVGNRGRQLSRGGEGGYTLNQVNPQYLSLGTQLNQLVANPFFGQGGSGVVANAQVSRAQLLRPYPQFGAIYPLFSQGATSDYNSLQVTFSKRLSKGILFEGSYVWSKTLDEGTSYQDSYNTRGNRAISSVHVPQRLVFSGVYELPFGRGRHFGNGMSRWLDLAAGGWQVNGIWTVQSGALLGISATNQAGLFTEAIRANTNGVSAAQSGDAHQRLDRWFDTSTFSQPAPFTLGNLGPLVNGLRGHHINNLDASIFKQFAITEKFRLQFRAEAFNALNRVRFGNPNTTVTAGANFGRVTTQSNDPRQMQFGLKLIW